MQCVLSWMETNDVVRYGIVCLLTFDYMYLKISLSQNTLKELLLQYLTEQNSTHLFGLIVVYPITLQGHKTWWINNG